MNKVQEAVESFGKLHNCCQAVFSTYCEQFGLEKELALKIACGFAAGMGRQGETCGAVTGAYMLIGLKHGKVIQDDNQAKEKTYELVQEFSRKFKERNKFTACKELLGAEPLTGDRTVLAEKYKVLCPIMVKDAAEIIEELLEIK